MTSLLVGGCFSLNFISRHLVFADVGAVQYCEHVFNLDSTQNVMNLL